MPKAAASDVWFDCPAKYILHLWAICEQLTPDAILGATPPDGSFADRISQALAHGDAASVARDLVSIVGEGEQSLCRGRMLAVMREFDTLVLSIHPRSARWIYRDASSLPNWLLDLSDQRRLVGHYRCANGFRLVPKGPLQRHAREETASNAVSFADRFAAISVVPESLTLDGRDIKVTHIVVARDAARGVPPGNKPGQERITFLPIARNRADIVFKESDFQDKKFVEFSLNRSINIAASVKAILDDESGSDIAILPEFMMSAGDFEQLSSTLIEVADAPRLLIAGTGNSKKDKAGLRWNESAIVNGLGALLWRQQKLWPAGITRDRALQFGLTDPGISMIYERNCAGDEIIVADIDSLGRCVVLICQDLQAKPLSDELIRAYQPDWVFSPILDSDIPVGRWAHQRCFALSALSRARFVAVTSTALPRSHGSTGDPTFGLAVGPQAPARGSDDPNHVLDDGAEDGRVYMSVMASHTIEWGTGGWERTTLS